MQVLDEENCCPYCGDAEHLSRHGGFFIDRDERIHGIWYCGRCGLRCFGDLGSTKRVGLAGWFLYDEPDPPEPPLEPLDPTRGHAVAAQAVIGTYTTYGPVKVTTTHTANVTAEPIAVSLQQVLHDLRVRSPTQPSPIRPRAPHGDTDHLEVAS